MPSELWLFASQLCDIMVEHEGHAALAARAKVVISPMNDTAIATPPTIRIVAISHSDPSASNPCW
jgi:hypothetical protein